MAFGNSPWPWLHGDQDGADFHEGEPVWDGALQPADAEGGDRWIGHCRPYHKRCCCYCYCICCRCCRCYRW